MREIAGYRGWLREGIWSQEARDGFFVDGAGSDFDDLGQLQSVDVSHSCGD